MLQENSTIPTPSTFSLFVTPQSKLLYILKYSQHEKNGNVSQSNFFSPKRMRIQNGQAAECFLLIASVTGFGF